MLEAFIGIAIGEGVVIIALIIALIAVVKKNKKSANKADNVVVKDGVRYTKTADETDEDGDVAVTHRTGDVVLARGRTYTAKKDGKVLPGKYTVLSADESADAFNLRVGNVVREYKHASDIVLAEGEKITAVSHTVILR